MARKERIDHYISARLPFRPVALAFPRVSRWSVPKRIGPAGHWGAPGRDSRISVQMMCLGLKAAGNGWFRFIDAHPVGAVSTAALAGACTLYGAYGLLHHLVRLVVS